MVMLTFRQTSTSESGWLSVKGLRNDSWIERWGLFEDGVLHFFEAENLQVLTDKISMERVISLRTNVICYNF
jgi:hypothetical protein